MGTGFNPASWTTFFSAQVSASAALAGLTFVAVSINLGLIVKQRRLVARAARSLLGMMGVLLASVLCLIPAIGRVWLGWELALLGSLIWATATWAQSRASHRHPSVGVGARVFFSALTQISILPFLVGGISLIVGRGGGLYWLAAGVIFSLFAALLEAWVLLIEIQR
jgi:hypothetical protein